VTAQRFDLQDFDDLDHVSSQRRKSTAICDV
jgi:hypothetical protein